MTGDSCTIEGCEKLASHSRATLCEMHYTRIRRGGSTEKRRQRKTCTECGGPAFGHGLCQKHYAKARRTDPSRPRCARPDCDRAADTRGMCGYHYAVTFTPETVARHRESGAARSAEWRLANPERFKAQRRNGKVARRAREMGVTVRKTDLEQILVEHGMVCHICSGEIVDRSDLNFDHVIPLAKGGPHVPENIRPAHAACNRRKSARLLA